MVLTPVSRCLILQVHTRPWIHRGCVNGAGYLTAMESQTEVYAGQAFPAPPCVTRRRVFSRGSVSVLLFVCRMYCFSLFAHYLFGDGPSSFFFLLFLPVSWFSRCSWQVFLEDDGETRAAAAATAVDRLLDPDNFVLMVEENDFGPINAVVTGVSR